MADNSNNKNKKDRKHWFKDLKVELKKVTWLTPKQLTKNTATVIAMVLIVAVLVFTLDFAFETLNSKGVESLKKLVTNTSVTENVSTDNNTIENGTVENEENTAVENADEDNTNTEENQTEDTADTEENTSNVENNQE